MTRLVIGLSQSGDTSALHRLLAAAGLPTDGLQTIDPGDLRSPLAGGLADAGLFSSGSGTGVPGIDNRSRAAAFSGYDSVSTRLGHLEIPESAIENYAEALERGRFVIADAADAADVDRVAAVFEAAGIVNVRRY